MSTRSTVLAVGVAVCALAAAAQPVRSWASRRGATGESTSQVDQDRRQTRASIRGQYPNVDIQLIDDYENDSRKPKANPAIVRIHMDVDLKTGHALKEIRAVLDNPNSTPDDIFAAFTAATKVVNDQSRGTQVVKAALGKQ